MSLPKYQCFKVVRAMKIERMEPWTAGQVILSSNEPDIDSIVVNNEYMTKHKPQIGGYFVLYEDDYKSFSPADAFLAGYKRIV